MLQRLVASFCRIEGVRSATLLDADGLHLAGVIAAEEDAPALDRVGPSLLRAESIAVENGLGQIDQLWLESDAGHRVIARMADGHTLLLESDPTPNIGRLRHAVERMRPALAQLI